MLSFWKIPLYQLCCSVNHATRVLVVYLGNQASQGCQSGYLAKHWIMLWRWLADKVTPCYILASPSSTHFYLPCFRRYLGGHVPSLYSIMARRPLHLAAYVCQSAELRTSRLIAHECFHTTHWPNIHHCASARWQFYRIHKDENTQNASHLPDKRHALTKRKGYCGSHSTQRVRINHCWQTAFTQQMDKSDG